MCFNFHFLFRENKSRGACTCSTSREFINLNLIRGEHKKPNFCLSLCIYTAVSIWNNGTLNTDIVREDWIYVSLCKKMET